MSGLRLAGFLLLAALCPAAGAQSIDLSSLDKLAKNASEANEVSLDGNNLSTAARFLYGDDPDIKEARRIIEGIKGIWVRNFVFKNKDEYSKGDLSNVRKQLQGSGWSKVMESKSHADGDNIEVFLRSENQKTTGLSVISQEPKALTVVVILGSIDLERLGKLSGNLGIPPLQLKRRPNNDE
jgi:hypothetical protein